MLSEPIENFDHDDSAGRVYPCRYEHVIPLPSGHKRRRRGEQGDDGRRPRWREARRGGFVAAWPTKGRIYFSRLDVKGESSGRAEVETPGRSGMRTGVLALTAPDGSTLVAWKKDGQLGWQLYGGEGEPSGPTGSATGPGDGVAGVVGKDGRFLLFR
jgi:hypothetical protein